MARLRGDLDVTGLLTAGEIGGLREVSRIVGDGVSTVFTVCHSLGERLVLPTLYDGVGREIKAAYRCGSNGEVSFYFYFPPSNGEVIDVVIRR